MTILRSLGIGDATLTSQPTLRGSGMARRLRCHAPEQERPLVHDRRPRR